MPTSVTSKGQVTIPKKLRDYLGVVAGSAVDFELAEDGRVLLRKAETKGKQPGSRLKKLRGVATSGMSTNDIMALTRG